MDNKQNDEELPDQTPCCANCHFWLAIDETGACRFLPPVLIPRAYGVDPETEAQRSPVIGLSLDDWSQPTTHCSDWCGQHVPVRQTTSDVMTAKTDNDLARAWGELSVRSRRAVVQCLHKAGKVIPSRDAEMLPALAMCFVDDLQAVSGCGRLTMPEVAKAMADRGLQFRDGFGQVRPTQDR